MRKLEICNSEGGSMGPNLSVKVDGRWLGHLYIDEDEDVDVEAFIAEICARFILEKEHEKDTH